MHLHRPAKSKGLPRSVYWLYAVGVFSLASVWHQAGFWPAFQAAIACMMFWAAALMHERYTYR